MFQIFLFLALAGLADALVYTDFYENEADAKQMAEIRKLRSKQELLAKELADIETELDMKTLSAATKQYTAEVEQSLAELEDRKVQLVRKQDAITRKANKLQKKWDASKGLRAPPPRHTPEERAKAAAMSMNARVDSMGKITREERIESRQKRINAHAQEGIEIDYNTLADSILSLDTKVVKSEKSGKAAEAMMKRKAKKAARAAKNDVQQRRPQLAPDAVSDASLAQGVEKAKDVEHMSRWTEDGLSKRHVQQEAKLMAHRAAVERSKSLKTAAADAAA